MRELAVPAVVTIPNEANLSDPVFDNAASDPGHAAFSVRRDGIWADVTAKDFADDVTALAKGLIAAGIDVGDRVALMSKTRYEWTLVDYAIWTAGAITVPIYETSSAEQVQWILSDSGAVAAVVETGQHQELADGARPDAPELQQLWQIDGGGLDQLRTAGAEVGDDAVGERRQATNADSLCSIIYTSGTTGRPKGCELTHGNMLFDIGNAIPGLTALFNKQGSTLLFLPLAHVFARLIQCGAVQTGARLGHAADVKNLLADLAGFKPTFLLSVPRVFEKVYNASKQKAHAAGKGKIFDAAEDTAIAHSEALDSGGPGLALKVKHTLFDKLVYSKLRAALGGQCHSAVSGGAPLGARLGHFFRGIGLTIYEGYGLTETSAASTVNLREAIKIGTVGKPLPGVSVRIADDGEILLKGPHIMRGYWKNDTATREVISADGWLSSGDLGELDDDGFLRITGRKKEIIVTAGGKNVAPSVLEDRLRSHPLVSQCMAVGDQQPFIACLVTIDPDAFGPWKAAHSKEEDATVGDLAEDPDLRADIQAAVDEANRAVSSAEAIKKFRILPVDFTQEGGELTPKMSVKRNVVLKQYADDVSALYAR
ncbi:MAG: long-chain fatty acid--CoA ligase [Geodermatophilaceae bacterium]|nr:long-chain fatty acid--CoA ligase [Geodermatophilaceae bacterium]